KLLPEMVTLAPTGPLVGFSVLMAGGCCCVATVKLPALLTTPFTVTVTACAPAPTFGTVATICDALHELTVALVLPKRSVLVPCELPKLLPLTVTELPTAPPDG